MYMHERKYGGSRGGGWRVITANIKSWRNAKSRHLWKEGIRILLIRLFGTNNLKERAILHAPVARQQAGDRNKVFPVVWPLSTILLNGARLADHVTLKFNSNMSTAAIFLDIEKAFDTTWHPGLFYKLAKLKFSNNLIKLITSFLSERKFRVSVEGELSTPRYMQARVPQGSVLSPTLYNLYINDTPKPQV
jgi:hypothetical protein